MDDFAYFKDTETGKIAQYPHSFAALFPNLVEVSEEEAECPDCWKKREVADVTFDNPIRVGSRDADDTDVVVHDDNDLLSDEPEDNDDGE
jgi:hypothetical protein